jgi:hypothetical protein
MHGIAKPNALYTTDKNPSFRFVIHFEKGSVIRVDEYILDTMLFACDYTS